MANPPPRLLSSPYTPPPVRRGDRATGLFRDADVVVTSWTSAQISWPCCCRPDTHGGGSGLLETEELARAFRSESAAAVGYWRGGFPGVVRRRAQGPGGGGVRNPPSPPAVPPAAGAPVT